MALIKNPPKLNGLQLRTLTILQQLGRSTETSTKNASGLNNQGVWKALEQKGLARAYFPLGIAPTPDGVVYDTGLSEKILMRSEH